MCLPNSKIYTLFCASQIARKLDICCLLSSFSISSNAWVCVCMYLCVCVSMCVCAWEKCDMEPIYHLKKLYEYFSEYFNIYHQKIEDGSNVQIDFCNFYFCKEQAKSWNSMIKALSKKGYDNSHLSLRIIDSFPRILK